MSENINTHLKGPEPIKPWVLSDYLDAQESGISLCRERYALEFQGITELGKLFDKIVSVWRPMDRQLTDQERLRVVFLFSVKTQMSGAVFSLLRLRVVDALNGSRYAVEATGIAHLLSKKPELFPVYLEAYPNIEREGSINQWKPSNKYRDVFHTGKLFDCLETNPAEGGKRLREAYAIICYRASHAGPGILLNLKKRNGKIFYHANELDEETVDRSWAIILVYYFDMFLVFYEMFKEGITAEDRTALQSEMEALKSNLNPLAQEAVKRASRTRPDKPSVVADGSVRS
jgi:hypothetical protein